VSEMGSVNVQQGNAMQFGKFRVLMEINIGEIITFLGLGFSVVWFFAAQDSAIKAEAEARRNLQQVTEERQQSLSNRLDREVQFISVSLSDIKATQLRIEDKLDHKADK